MQIKYKVIHLLIYILLFRYAIPPRHGRRFERLVYSFFTSNSNKCNALLRHKMTILSPHILKEYSIPFDKVTEC